MREANALSVCIIDCAIFEPLIGTGRRRVQNRREKGRAGSSAGLAGIVGIAMSLMAAGPAGAGGAPDPAMVIGPDECGECHEREVEIWRETPHAETYLAMPRDDEAREIADKMEIRRIRTDNLCAECHFTMKSTEGEKEVIAGVSCEACHGGARDWNRIHSDFGGKDVTAETETPEHREQRIAAAEAAGMIRPANLYALADNCFSCHTVAEEELVNTGGHPAGSEFDLVAWSQGEVRHNVWFSEDETNREASPERKRMMFVVGKALDLEHALRAVARAEAKDKYAVAMAKRAQAAALGIQEITKAVSVPEIGTMLEIAGAVKLSLGNTESLLAAADRIGEAARAFADAHDGSTLAGIDPLLPAPSAYKGTPAP